MNSFNQFNITSNTTSFVGDKIKMIKILDKQIIVHHYKLDDSKVYKDKNRGTCKCLQLQITYNDEKYVIFTSSSGLIDMIQQIPLGGFPFTTTIIKENDRFIFS
jgi:hypothetical protein